MKLNKLDKTETRTMIRLICYLSAFLLFLFDIVLVAYIVLKPNPLSWVGWFYAVVILLLVAGLLWLMSYVENSKWFLPDKKTVKRELHKERVEYIIEGKHFIGKPVNISGVVVQAKSMDELKDKMKIICGVALDYMNGIMTQKEPFEFVEITDTQIWLYGERIAKIRTELETYKAIYGDLK